MTRFDWVKCPNCNHKLFKLYEEENTHLHAEIKCSSCKNIVELTTDPDKIKFFFKKK